VLTPVLMVLSLVLSTAYLVDGSYNPFLYFRF
jgi:alginate O-acetyltransferase complex protein AlgI